MVRYLGRIGCVISFAILLSACSANHNSIFRHKPLKEQRDSITLTDAKQRAVLVQYWKKRVGNQDADRARFCAEPSPDFVSVMAQSLGAGGSFGQTADPRAVEAAFNLAYSSAETGTTIARTQTINMLRELMFRTCERFLSGGYDEMELSVQAVRDQRLMVSVLAIEQLTGAVAPSPVVLGARSSSSSGLGGEAIETFDKLRDEKKKADNAQEKAQAAYDEEHGKKEDGTDKKCTALDARLEDDPTAQVNQDDKAQCEKLKETLASAKATAKEVSEAYSTVKEAMETGGVSASTVSKAIADGGLNRATPGSVQNVAQTVENIVELNFSDNTETMLFCL